MTEKIRIGVIGCGKISQTRHLPEYAANPAVELMGYFDFSQPRAQAIAAQYGGVAYDSLAALLADPRIDAVSVCVANRAHAQVAIQALKAGKHVLCEKPMATTMADCEQMVAAAKAANKRLMIDQNQRFAKSHQYAKKLLAEGIIGDVLTFKSNFGHGGPETWSVDGGSNTWFFDKQQSQYGAIFDLGVHKLDLMRYLLDADVKEVSAKVVTLDKRHSDGKLIDVDDNAICSYVLSNGAVGTITSSWTYYGEEDNSTVLYGTKGIMKLYTDPQYSIKIALRTGEKINYQVDAIQTNDHQTSSGVIDEFVSALQTHHQTISDASSVLGSMRGIFASVEAGRLAQTVTL